MRNCYLFLFLFYGAFLSTETLVVKNEGKCLIDIPTCFKFSMNKTSNDGTLTSLAEFEFSGISQGDSFVNEYEGKFYLSGPSSYAIFDMATNTITFEDKPEGAVIQRQIGWNGDEIISQETSGEIHIGENSLVTIEESGVQQLYATNVSDEQININIKKGTDLLIDGVSVAGSLSTNATNIATNTTDIATNKTNIATNATNIAANTAEIATYTDSIAGNTTAIAAIGSDLDAYKASTNSQMNYMKSDYSSGIASAVAMSQFNLAQDGFSIGIGRGSYNDEDETAFGLGYGGEFKNGTLFKLQASKSGDASGVGLTISF